MDGYLVFNDKSVIKSHYLNEDIYNSMSNKDYIKEVAKMTNNIGYNGNAVTGTQDKVFLLSAKECGLSCPSWYSSYSGGFNAEGTIYTWFESNTVDGWFWLRSPCSSTNSLFFYCLDGALNFGGAHGEITVRPAFVIG